MKRSVTILLLSFALTACASDGADEIDPGAPPPAAGTTVEPGEGDVVPPAPTTGSGAPLTIVVDKRSGRFYASDHPGVADIPADQREDFANPYEALDRGYFPDGESDPMGRWE